MIFLFAPYPCLVPPSVPVNRTVSPLPRPPGENRRGGSPTRLGDGGVATRFPLLLIPLPAGYLPRARKSYIALSQNPDEFGRRGARVRC